MALQVLFDYRENLKMIAKEKEFLDTLDLKPLLIKGTKISDLMDEIKEKYNPDDKEELYLFDNMDSYDFMDYLKDRYKTRFQEVSYYEVL